MKLAASILAVASFLAFSAPVVGAQSTTTAVAKPMHTYRLTYTLTEMDGGKRVGVQHYSMTIDPGSSRSQIKLGSKVPIIVSTKSGQYTYLDVGISINAILTSGDNGIQVDTELEKSDIADTPTNSESAGQPIIRQAVLDTTTMLRPGKSVLLGSLDVPGSTHHYDVELALEQVY